MSAPTPTAIALGSNLGDRAAHIEAAFVALANLPKSRLVARGPIIETAAVGLPGGADPGGPYLNSAAVVETTLEPIELLAHLHEIERQRGRDRRSGVGAEAWAPRTLDLDLLLYGDRIINDGSTLRIPHPRMHERRFVLEPLAAIAPDMLVPTPPSPTPHPGKTVAQLLAELPRVTTAGTGGAGRKEAQAAR